MHSDFLALVKDELLQETFVEKANDLYDFTQSHDLRASTAPASTLLREALYGARFREFLTAMTGIALNDHIDISSAIYRDTDKLLCHDDELEGSCWSGSASCLLCGVWVVTRPHLDVYGAAGCDCDLISGRHVSLCSMLARVFFFFFFRATHRIHFVPCT
jgi:hypothetical protein